MDLSRRRAPWLIPLVLLGAAALLSVATSVSSPAIERVTPGLGATSVALDQPLEITFEHPVDPDTVNDESVRIQRLGDGRAVAVTMELSGSGHQLVVRPLSLLAPETDYALELDLGRLSSQDGQAYVGLRYDAESTAVWETTGVLQLPFSTRQALVVSRAFLLSEDEIAGDGSIDEELVDEARTDIWVYFSEPVDPEGITLGAVTLFEDGGDLEGGRQIALDLRFSEDLQRLRVLPLSPLSGQRTYTLTLTNAIRTPGGSALGEGEGERLEFDLSQERLR